MKILLYINAIHEGGAERVMVNLAKQFANAGNEVVMLTSFVDSWEYPVDKSVKRLSMEQQEIKQSRLARNYSRIMKLRRVCMEEKPDILISFMQEPNFRAILATLGQPVKTIVSVRNDPNKEYAGKIGKIVGKYILPMADGCVFQTEQAKAWFPVKLQKKSTVIMNAVNETFFRVTREKTADIITTGRLTAQKNHAMLIHAFSKIAQKHPNQNLLIYGAGELESELMAQIQTLGLDGRVLLKGKTTDVPSVLAGAKMFVLSSDYEGMPNALMEALAVGVPSISTDCPCGGPAMLIRQGENGLLVPVGDTDAMAEAMDQMLSEEAFAEQLGNCAREQAVQFKPEAVFEQWKAYVESIVNDES